MLMASKKDNIFFKIIKTFQNQLNGLKTNNNQQSQINNDNYELNIDQLTKIFNKQLTNSGLFQKNELHEIYTDYEFIYSHIPEQNKSLRLLTSYILKPDSLTENTIIFKYQNKIQNNYIQQIFETLQVEDKLYQQIFNMLFYGDSYFKINYQPLRIKTDKKDELFLQMKVQNEKNTNIVELLTESNKYLKENKVIPLKNTYDKIIIDKDKKTKYIHNQVKPISENEQIITSDNYETVYLPISLQFLSANKVYKLSQYGLEGYIYVKKNPLNNYDKRISGLSQIDEFNSIPTLINQIKDEINDHPNIQNIIIEDESDKNSMYEYIPEDSMIDFQNATQDMFNPYGVSNFEPIRFAQRELITLELQMTIYKVNKAPDRRIFRINTSGINPSDIPAYFENMKQKLKNQFQIDFEGRLDELPSTFGVLEDYYIPVIDGEPLFEIDTLQGEDVSKFKDELEYLKNKVISGIGIPPQYVAYGDNHATGSRLLQQDEEFQRDIVQYQRFAEKQLDKLVYYTLRRLNQLEYYSSNDIKIQKPEFFSKLLYYEIQNSKITYQNSLKQFDISNSYILKEILGFTNEELKKINDYKRKDNINSGGNANEQGGQSMQGGGF